MEASAGELPPVLGMHSVDAEKHFELKTCLSLANNIYRITNRLVYYNNRIEPSDLPHFFATVQRANA